MKILLLSKETKWCQKAIDFAQRNFKDLKVEQSNSGESTQEGIFSWKGDVLISFLCPYIIPERLLRKAKLYAINFHPASPEYPGIGCYNFAIYNGESEYGVTCHHMDKVPDAGKIIKCVRFPILPEDSVFSLKERSMEYLLKLFFEIVSLIKAKKPLPCSKEIWTRKHYTRKELNELCRVTKDMGKDEIRKRVRATSFPRKPGAYIELGGYKFEVINKQDA